MCSVSTASSTALARRCSGAHNAVAGAARAAGGAPACAGKAQRAERGRADEHCAPTDLRQRRQEAPDGRSQRHRHRTAGLQQAVHAVALAVAPRLSYERVSDAPFAADAEATDEASQPQRPEAVGDAGQQRAERERGDAGHHRWPPADAVGEAPEGEAAERRRRQRPAFDPLHADEFEPEVASDRGLGEREEDQIVEVEDPTEPAERQHAQPTVGEQRIGRCGGRSRWHRGAGYRTSRRRHARHGRRWHASLRPRRRSPR
jgi:hypothetical protein